MSEQQQNAGWKMGPRGFTLIELLVVISIMSLLMSILLPSLNRAREQGKRVVCSSNLRQLTLAWSMYAMDNDDKLCLPTTHWNDNDYGFPRSHPDMRHNWVVGGNDAPPWYQLNHIGDSETGIREGVLWPYIRTLDLYKCKSDRSDLLRSYSISNTMGGRFEFRLSKKRPFKTLAGISRTAERMVFIDADSLKRWISYSFLPIYDIHTETPIWGTPSGWVSDQTITARHSDGFNMSFADTHCEYWKWKDPRTVKLANEELTLADDVHENNPDISRLIEVLKGR